MHRERVKALNHFAAVENPPPAAAVGNGVKSDSEQKEAHANYANAQIAKNNRENQ